MKKLAVSILLFLPIFAGCNFFPEEREDIPVAKVGNSILYENDLSNLFPSGLSVDDSIMLRENFINSWVREQIILQKALKNLSEEQKNKTQELTHYYNSLIRYEYDKSLIEQRLDTSISRREILSYYNQNQKDFELRSNIIKLLYLKLPKEAPHLEKVKLWLRSSNVKDMDSLQQYVVKFAVNFSLDDNTWYNFDDILKEVPIKLYDHEHFLRNNNFVKVEDHEFVYLVYIRDFRTKNEISPIEFEEANIRKIILHKRKNDLLRKMEEAAFKEAYDKQSVVIY